MSSAGYVRDWCVVCVDPKCDKMQSVLLEHFNLSSTNLSSLKMCALHFSACDTALPRCLASKA